MARRLRGNRRGTNSLWARRKIRICILRHRCDRSDVGWTMSVGRPRNLGLTLTRSQTLDAQGRRRRRELGAGTTHDRKLSLPRDLSLGHQGAFRSTPRSPARPLPLCLSDKKPYESENSAVSRSSSLHLLVCAVYISHRALNRTPSCPISLVPKASSFLFTSPHLLPFVMSVSTKEHDYDLELDKRQHQDAEAAGIPALANVDDDAHVPNQIHELVSDVPLAGVRRVETVQAVWTKKSRWVLFIA